MHFQAEAFQKVNRNVCRTARAPKTKEEIFYMLHSASKIREIKLKERK